MDKQDKWGVAGVNNSLHFAMAPAVADAPVAFGILLVAPAEEVVAPVNYNYF